MEVACSSKGSRRSRLHVVYSHKGTPLYIYAKVHYIFLSICPVCIRKSVWSSNVRFIIYYTSAMLGQWYYSFVYRPLLSFLHSNWRVRQRTVGSLPLAIFFSSFYQSHLPALAQSCLLCYSKPHADICNRVFKNLRRGVVADTGNIPFPNVYARINR